MRRNGEDATNLTSKEIFNKLKALPSGFSERTKKPTEINHSASIVEWRNKVSNYITSIAKSVLKQEVDAFNGDISYLFKIPDNEENSTELTKADNFSLLVEFMIKYSDYNDEVPNFKNIVTILKQATDIWKENKCWDKEYHDLCNLHDTLTLQVQYVISDNEINELKQKLSSIRTRIAEIYHKRGMEMIYENIPTDRTWLVQNNHEDEAVSLFIRNSQEHEKCSYYSFYSYGENIKNRLDKIIEKISGNNETLEVILIRGKCDNEKTKVQQNLECPLDETIKYLSDKNVNVIKTIIALEEKKFSQKSIYH